MYAKKDLQRQIWISHPPPRTAAHSWSASNMPTSSAAAPPLPTQLLCTRIQTHTQQSWNWLKQRRSGAADSHNHTTWEKVTDHVFMICRGRNREICYRLMKTAAWRKWAFWINNFFGVLGLFHSQCILTTNLNTSWLAISVCHLPVRQIIEKSTIKAPANNGFLVNAINSRV